MLLFLTLKKSGKFPPEKKMAAAHGIMLWEKLRCKRLYFNIVILCQACLSVQKSYIWEKKHKQIWCQAQIRIYNWLLSKLFSNLHSDILLVILNDQKHFDFKIIFFFKIVSRMIGISHKFCIPNILFEKNDCHFKTKCSKCRAKWSKCRAKCS